MTVRVVGSDRMDVVPERAATRTEKGVVVLLDVVATSSVALDIMMMVVVFAFRIVRTDTS